MHTHFPLAVTLALVCAAPQPHAQELLEQHRAFLSRIKSPEDLVFPLLPKTYSVPVTLSGPIALEMKRTLAELKLDEPRYIEILDRRKRFDLLLANESYSAETRDLLSGILNPVEMIEAILKSIVRYREKEQLMAMLRETQLTRTLETRNGLQVYVVRLAPNGKRFAYSYEDMGAYVQETWLTALSLVVDSATMIAQELELVKYSRMFRGDDADRPTPAKRRYRYVFAYATTQAVTVPAQLLLYVDDSLALTIAATYRMHEDFLVFDSRRICYHLQEKGTESCLEMKYGTYRFDTPVWAIKSAAEEGKEARKVKQAAALAHKATTALKEGKIEAAVRTLRSIAQNYPGTPQAVEAQKLLEGLPDGL